LVVYLSKRMIGGPLSGTLVSRRKLGRQRIFQQLGVRPDRLEAAFKTKVH